MTATFSAFNSDLTKQTELLIDIISKNSYVYDVLLKVQTLNIDNFYVGAGCITQTVWNYLSGFSLEHGIKDIDFVYFDNIDLSNEGEDRILQVIRNICSDSPIQIDVKNQARVHLWYKEHFGYDINPYKSLEEAINTWPTTSTAIGIRLRDNEWKIYAPFGLNDLFGKIVKANKVQITKEIYEKKIKQWTVFWDDLIIEPW